MIRRNLQSTYHTHCSPGCPRSGRPGAGPAGRGGAFHDLARSSLWHLPRLRRGDPAPQARRTAADPRAGATSRRRWHARPPTIGEGRRPRHQGPPPGRSRRRRAIFTKSHDAILRTKAAYHRADGRRLGTGRPVADFTAEPQFAWTVSGAEGHADDPEELHRAEPRRRPALRTASCRSTCAPRRRLVYPCIHLVPQQVPPPRRPGRLPTGLRPPRHLRLPDRRPGRHRHLHPGARPVRPDRHRVHLAAEHPRVWIADRVQAECPLPVLRAQSNRCRGWPSSRDRASRTSQLLPILSSTKGTWQGDLPAQTPLYR